MTNAELAKRADIAIEHMTSQVNAWSKIMKMGASKFPDGSPDALGFLRAMNGALEMLGEFLNDMDGVDEEDERSTELVFAEMKKLFGAEE